MKLCSLKRVLAVILSIIAIMTSGCSKKTNSSSAKSQDSSQISSLATNTAIDTTFKSTDFDVGYDESSAVNVTLKGNSADISASGAKFEDGNLIISSEGTYVISGTISDGQIIVNTSKKNDVRLVFNGVEINCSDNSGILINQADKVVITLQSDTKNSITDGSTYKLDNDNQSVDGAIFSRADLTINGTGELAVTANYKHGIVCKDDLVIIDGVYSIKSQSGGIYGKDSVKINNGTFDLTAGSNGIKSSNIDDESKGYIYINGGKFNITAGNDGIESANIISIDNGDFVINTGGGSENASMKSDGQPNDQWGQWRDKPNGMGGQHPDGDNFDGGMAPPDRTQLQDNEVQGTFNKNNEQFTAVANETDTSQNNSDTTDSSSAKALKASKEIDINGGKITIDSSDDAIHSNGSVNVSGGTVNAKSGDDGIHADGSLLISGGKVNIEKSYEGIEGLNITISGGEVSVVSSDDGINDSGGSNTGNADRGGKDNFNTSSDGETTQLKITGGVVRINASGDGLDSNGNLIIEGGEIYVSGPINDGNGAIDFGDNSSSWITGGTIIAVGSTGMAESFGAGNSTQYSVLHNLSSKVAGETEIIIKDSSGKTIISYKPEKEFQSVVFSSPDIKDGETYTITAGSVSETVTTSGISTSNGKSGFGGRGGMRGAR